jgi:subtilase family serine protease
VDVHYRQHWIRRIEAKLDVPLAEAAAPDAMVDRVVHKPARRLPLAGVGAACWLA